MLLVISVVKLSKDIPSVKVYDCSFNFVEYCLIFLISFNLSFLDKEVVGNFLSIKE